MNQDTIKEYIRALEHMTGFFQSLLEEERKIPPKPETEWDAIAELTELRMLANSERWPSAVPEELLCEENEDQKLARASGIIDDFITEDFTDKKFLDFGCGEAHVPYIVANLKSVSLSVGYDIEDQNWNHFEKTENLFLTTSLNQTKEKGPYDIILINDVLDHAYPSLILEEAKNLKAENGRIYLRCHPWTSRHGSHLYKKLNKAYLHLVFTEKELYSIGLKPINKVKFLDPIKEYKDLISMAGLKILNERKIEQSLDLLFTNEPKILRRIKENWTESDNELLANGTEFPRESLELQFIDFILE
jgi:2-polyprenyl-3-methyl-5-hydroxy-6-metoxy-1,4-benzoquinol methylase